MKKRVSKKPATTETETTNAAEKPSAAARTVPLTMSTATCPECAHTCELGDCTRRADGSPECPECGAVVNVAEVKATKPSSDKATCDACATTFEVATAHKRTDGCLDCPACGKKITREKPAEKPRTEIGSDDSKKPKAYCNECGAEWGRVNGVPFPSCGHGEKPGAGMVDDPSKATNYNPPAGLTNPMIPKRMGGAVANETEAEAEEVPQQARPANLSVTPPTATISLYPDRLEVAWGKSMFRIADYSTFTVSEFKSTSAVHENESRVEVGKRMLAEMKELADAAFAEQCEWYFKKLGFLDSKIEKYSRSGGK